MRKRRLWSHVRHRSRVPSAWLVVFGLTLVAGGAIAQGPASAVYRPPGALAAIKRDKKVVNGRLHFVIAIEIGATMTVDDVTEDELRAVLLRLGLKG